MIVVYVMVTTQLWMHVVYVLVMAVAVLIVPVFPMALIAKITVAPVIMTLPMIVLKTVMVNGVE